MSTLSERVVFRHILAKEFPTEDALKKYLRSHPGADPKKHTVKKQEGGKGGKDEPSHLDTKEFKDSLKSVADKLNMTGQEMADALAKKWHVEIPGMAEREKAEKERRKTDHSYDFQRGLDDLARSMGMSRAEMGEALKKKWGV